MANSYTGNPFAFRFGTFQTAVNDPAVRSVPGGVQMYVWQDLRNEYLARGEPLPAGSFAAVNDLLSLAGQQRRARLALERDRALSAATGRPLGVTAEHIAPHLDTRPVSEMKEGAQHRIVYLTQEIVDGEPITSYRTHDVGYALPQTIDSLSSAVEEAAQVEAADYGYEWGGMATPVAIYSY